MPPDFGLLHNQEHEESKNSSDPNSNDESTPSSSPVNVNVNQQESAQRRESNDKENVEPESDSFTIIHDLESVHKDNDSSTIQSINISPTKRPREINMSVISLGQQFDVLDNTNRWCEAEVSNV